METESGNGLADMGCKQAQHKPKRSNTKVGDKVHDVKTQKTATPNQKGIPVTNEMGDSGVRDERNDSSLDAIVEGPPRKRARCYSLTQLQAMRNRAMAPFFNREPEIRTYILKRTVVSTDGANESTLHPDSSSLEQVHPVRQPITPEDCADPEKLRNFARFLRAHASPRHQRVTAGGKIVPAEPNSPPPTFQKAFLDEFVGQDVVGFDPISSDTRAKTSITIHPKLKVPPGAQVLQLRLDGKTAITCRNGTLIHAELTDTGETKWRVMRTTSEIRDDFLGPSEQLFPMKSTFAFGNDVSILPGNQIGAPMGPVHYFDPLQWAVLGPGRSYSNTEGHSYDHPFSKEVTQSEDILRGSISFSGLMSALSDLQEVHAQERAALAQLERCFSAQKYLSQRDIQLYAEEKQRLLMKIASTHENIGLVREKAQSLVFDVPQQYADEVVSADEISRVSKAAGVSSLPSIQSRITFPPPETGCIVQYTDLPEIVTLNRSNSSKATPTSRLSATAPAFVPSVGGEAPQQSSDESSPPVQSRHVALIPNSVSEIAKDPTTTNVARIPEGKFALADVEGTQSLQGHPDKDNGIPQSSKTDDDLQAIANHSPETAKLLSQYTIAKSKRETESQQPQVAKCSAEAQAQDGIPRPWTWARLPEESSQEYQERLIKKRKSVGVQDRQSRPGLGVDDENAPLQAAGLVTKQLPNAAANSLAVSMRRTFQRSSMGIKG